MPISMPGDSLSSGYRSPQLQTHLHPPTSVTRINHVPRASVAHTEPVVGGWQDPFHTTRLQTRDVDQNDE